MLFFYFISYTFIGDFMFNRISNFIKDDEFETTIYNNKIHIKNYTRIISLEKNYISGVTFTGGDPLHENNLECVLNLVNKIRLLMPNKTIWLYTGYTLTECLSHTTRQEIISKCDIIVDGRYVDELKDITLKWRGSSNQKIWEKRNGEWGIYKRSAVYGQES